LSRRRTRGVKYSYVTTCFITKFHPLQ
jgi:hypothetical protein